MQHNAPPKLESKPQNCRVQGLFFPERARGPRRGGRFCLKGGKVRWYNIGAALVCQPQPGGHPGPGDSGGACGKAPGALSADVDGGQVDRGILRFLKLVHDPVLVGFCREAKRFQLCWGPLL